MLIQADLTDTDDYDTSALAWGVLTAGGSTSNFCLGGPKKQGGLGSRGTPIHHPDKVTGSVPTTTILPHVDAGGSDPRTAVRRRPC